MDKKHKFYLLFSIIVIIIFVDVTGYILIEDVLFVDALYMTLISISTVGFREVFPLSHYGKFFTMFVIVSGLGIFLYLAKVIAEFSIEGKLRKILGRRKMQTISKMKNHVVIAGFGTMGEKVAQGLLEVHTNFLIIECSNERFAKAEELGYNVIHFDATLEEGLKLAGIERAKTFISLLTTDADNVFTVLTARELNPGILIISRATNTINEKKLYKIGADRVVSPVTLATQRIVNTTIKPNVVNLMDLVTQTKDLSLSLEEFTISETSPLNGKSIRDSGIKEDLGAMVVAVKRVEHMNFNPSPNLKLIPGDILILIGEKTKMIRLS